MTETTPATCDACAGTGIVPCPDEDCGPGCWWCGGNGETECDDCDGTGEQS